MSTNITIIGAGLSGLSTAFHLETGYAIYEKEDRSGGLCRTERVDGFLFDYTGHWLHVRDPYVKRLIKDLMSGKLLSKERNSWIYSKGVYTRYPFQSNTHGLPIDVVKECLLEFIKARETNRSISDGYASFEDWILRVFGTGIARHFMIPYNEKLWTVHPREMTVDWLGEYVPKPTLEEVIDGALRDQQSKSGYNASFWYPTHGGIQSLVNAFESSLKGKIFFNHKVSKISTTNREIFFNGTLKRRYKLLISTIPLPELVRLIDDVPIEIRRAAEDLKNTSVYNLNLGIDAENLGDKHWVYFPEQEFVFYRVGFLSNIAPSLAPAGTSSIYTEVSYSRDHPIDRQAIDERIIHDLTKCGIIRETDKILVEKTFDIQYAYAIYDHNRNNNLKVIMKYLKQNNIISIGRYGRWEYSAMEDAILQGRSIASEVKGKVEQLNYGSE